MEIKISKEKPPVYERCKKAFGVTWDMGVIITYGDTIHCSVPISDDYLVHEKVHVRQQLEMGVEEWWEKYFTDIAFRLSQEVEAYREQLKYINENYDRLTRRFLFRHIILTMSSMYGKMCTQEQAIKLLS